MGRFKTVVSLLVGAVLLIGGGVALYSAIPALALRASYDSAPPCSAEREAITNPDCRYTSTATIVSVGEDNQISFQLKGDTRRTFSYQYLYVSDPSVSEGRQVRIELWSGRITRLADRPTALNPDESGNLGGLLTIGVICAILGIALVVWAILRRRDPDDRQPTMAPLATSGTLWQQ